jgi:hypothetical protein
VSELRWLVDFEVGFSVPLRAVAQGAGRRLARGCRLREISGVFSKATGFEARSKGRGAWGAEQFCFASVAHDRRNKSSPGSGILEFCRQKSPARNRKSFSGRGL